MNIEQFPDEIILKMCHEMDTEDLSNAIRTSARVNSICKEVMDKRYNEYKEKIRENFKRIKDEIINIMIDDSNDLPTFKLDYKSTHIAITSWVKYTIRDGNMRNVNTEEMISYIDSIFKDLMDMNPREYKNVKIETFQYPGGYQAPTGEWIDTEIINSYDLSTGLVTSRREESITEDD